MEAEFRVEGQGEGDVSGGRVLLLAHVLRGRGGTGEVGNGPPAAGGEEEEQDEGKRGNLSFHGQFLCR